MSYTPFKMKGPSLLKMVKKGKKAKKYGLAENLQEAKGTEFLEHERRMKESDKAKKDSSLKMSSEKKKKKYGLADDGRNLRNLRISELDRSGSSDKFKSETNYQSDKGKPISTYGDDRAVWEGKTPISEVKKEIANNNQAIIKKRGY